jgi:tetratricopeptide (TPR) repeat protein
MVAAVAIHGIKSGLDYRRYAHDVAEELMYYPSGRLLSVADLGFGPVIADVMWLRGIQYYGEHRRTDIKYPLAEHIFSTITNLDPGFLGAYRFGAMVLAEDAGTPAAAIGLLKKGLRSNPERWEIPFDLGFIYFIALDDYAKAAHYFRFASRLEDSPEVAKRFTAFAYRKAGRYDLARALWEEMYRSSSNQVVRTVAEFSIKRIELDATVQEIAEAAERYRAARGAFPRELSDLVAAGLMGSLPRDPFGGSYFLDPRTEAVSSTTKAEGDAEAAERNLTQSLKRYMALKGHYPQSLTELKQEGLIAEIPTVVGAEVTYDPATGSVGFDFAWREIRQ